MEAELRKQAEAGESVDWEAAFQAASKRFIPGLSVNDTAVAYMVVGYVEPQTGLATGSYGLKNETTDAWFATMLW